MLVSLVIAVIIAVVPALATQALLFDVMNVHVRLWPVWVLWWIWIGLYGTSPSSDGV